MLGRLLKNPPDAVVVVVSLVALGLAGVADQMTSRDVGVEALYLLPIVLAAWYLDRTWALGLAVLGAAMWLLLDILGSPPLWDPVVAMWNGLTRLAIFLGAAVSAGALKEALTRSEALARVDELTGAGNAVAFYDASRLEIDRSRRGGSIFSAAFFDVAGLDEVVASQGRGAADRLLRTLSDEVGAVIRSTDVLARLHDDMFAVLFPDTGRVESAAVLLKVSERALSSMRENTWDVHLRMGAATFVRAPGSVNELRRILEDVQHDARERGVDVIEHQAFS